MGRMLPPTRVTYADEYAIVSFYQDTRFERVRAMAATKAKVWCHEREWRMVRHEPGHGSMRFDPAALDGVIMGSRIPPEVEARVRVVLAQRNPSVTLLKAHDAEREFKLDIRPA